jgi:ribosomal protein L34E
MDVSVKLEIEDANKYHSRLLKSKSLPTKIKKKPAGRHHYHLSHIVQLWKHCANNSEKLNNKNQNYF